MSLSFTVIMVPLEIIYYLGMYWTDPHHIFRIDTSTGERIYPPIFSRSLKGHCYGNRFLARIGKNWHTPPSCCVFAFWALPRIFGCFSVLFQCSRLSWLCVMKLFSALWTFRVVSAVTRWRTVRSTLSATVLIPLRPLSYIVCRIWKAKTEERADLISAWPRRR